jgi:outer membrane protein TolC
MKTLRFSSLAVLTSILMGTALSAVAAQSPNGERHASETLHRLSLSEAIDLAFHQNPDLAAAEARIGEAESKVAEVASGFYPKLTARVGYDYTDNPSLAFSYIVAQRRFNSGDLARINAPGFVSNFRPEVIGTINLYRGGQDDYLKQAAELGVKASELQHAALRNRLAAAVTSAYYAVVSAPKQFEVAQKSLHTIQKEVGLTRDKVHEGIALRGDVLSLEVREKSSKESELQAKNNITLSKSALKSLLGEQKKELPEVQDTEISPPHLQGDLMEALETAYTHRPEVEAAKHQVQMRQHELDASKGAMLPRVNAYASYGSNSQTLDPGTYQGNASIGLNAEYDIYAGGALSAQVSGAERRLVEAQALEQRIRLDVENEVRQTYSTFEQSLERLKVAETAVSSADEALRLVSEQYHGGTATVTRYLEAETDRAAASMREIVARFETQVAEAQLLQAEGHWR